jgi:hypothetical protein
MKSLAHLFLFLLLILCNCCGRDNDKKPTGERPNIVFIMADDHAYQAISAYSDKLIQTPNILTVPRAQARTMAYFING